MKALTVQQPYAELIKLGLKKYEIRSHKTHYRGKLYIHAGLAKIRKTSAKNQFLSLLPDRELKYGHLLCQCRLIDCRFIDTQYLAIMRQNAPLNLYTEQHLGHYAWVLDDIAPLTQPIPAKGQLGLWNVEPQTPAPSTPSAPPPPPLSS